jgi:hypothetical protein
MIARLNATNKMETNFLKAKLGNLVTGNPHKDHRIQVNDPKP